MTDELQQARAEYEARVWDRMVTRRDGDDVAYDAACAAADAAFAILIEVATREYREGIERAEEAADEMLSALVRADVTLTSLKGWLRHNGHTEQIAWIDRALLPQPVPGAPEGGE